MHRFTLIKGNITTNIDIENIKFLIGENYIFKYELLFIFKNYFAKVKNSEYAIEYENGLNVLFDEKPIMLKDWCFYEVSPFYDLENDLKMGNKSLFVKYLETFETDLQYSETYNTVSILLSSLNEDFFDVNTPLKINNKNLSLRLEEITNQHLLKHCFAKIIEDDCECNAADMTMEEIILTQLKLIDKIASFYKTRYHLVYCYIPVFTKAITDFLLKMNQSNLFLIVNSLNTISNSLNDNYVCSKRNVDLANDEQLLEIIDNLPFFIELDALKSKLKSKLILEKIDNSTPADIEFMPWKVYN